MRVAMITSDAERAFHDRTSSIRVRATPYLVKLVYGDEHLGRPSDAGPAVDLELRARASADTTTAA